jgi:hypothetical protein
MLLLCSGRGIVEFKLSPPSHVQVFDLKGKCFIFGQTHPPLSPFLDQEQSNSNQKTGNSVSTVHRDPAPNWIPRNLIEVQLNPSAFVQMSFK